MTQPESSGRPGEVILELAGIHKSYGGVRALRGVDLQVRAGQVHALVGENGAGKSTLIKIVSGAETADAGTATMDGQGLSLGSTKAALDAGVATAYQEPQLFGELTVAENVFLGREERRGGGRVDWAGQRRRVIDLLGQLGLDPDMADVRVADLPVAEQQLVSIAKAVALSPRILILDEPSAILTDREIQLLFRIVGALRERGVGVIYISHRLDELSRITDHVTVLRDGAVVASKPTRELSVRAIAELMVGHELASEVVDRAPAEGEVLLDVNGLTRRPRFHDVSFAVRRGEVLGLYGLVGSGTGDIARALYGIDTADHGDVSVDGTVRRLESPAAATRAGIAMLPGNRKQQGVFADKSIAFNLSAAHLNVVSKLRVWVDRKRERQIAKDSITRFSIKAPGPGVPVLSLSGGNQQKVVLARQLVEGPRVLVLEEPTQGVDVGAKAEIHRLVLELADAGSAVLVVSSDLPEVLTLADRVLVVRDGRIEREFGRGARQADVLAAAAGDDGSSDLEDAS